MSVELLRGRHPNFLDPYHRKSGGLCQLARFRSDLNTKSQPQTMPILLRINQL